MPSDNLIAKAQISIHAPGDKVWDAFVNPAIIKEYMFGTTVTSDWKKGSSITWKGEMNGKAYEDKGVILEITPPEKLQYSHISQAGSEENSHTVTVTLNEDEDHTHVTLTQDNNPTEEAAAASQKNWDTMLQSLKKLLENK